MLPETLFEEIEAVFFDAEGTLFVIYPSVGHVYARICKEHGLLVSPQEMERHFREVFATLRKKNFRLDPEGCFTYWRQVFQETVRRFGSLDDLDAAFKKCYQAFASKENFRLNPGARESLTYLRKKGKKLALISNWDERLRALVADFGLEDLFEEIVISCEVGYAKPEPEIYLLTCRKLAVDPEKVLMVGDQLEEDVWAARKAGLWALRYPGGDLRRLFKK